ncbi:alpha/beta hydrolase family protein [Allofrancisella frigidaquae]|uniref:Lysophospholipase n=1 Tax=Allofrancisella frigidaquae TaxID=1085644 RepID=A0A6M3HTA8_9GAMM|nr:lysophospholipase [Allofrancisella frigidaquae]QIV94443.1 lysophospholipase [Allofrancisella frigidaquae]
MNKKIVLFLSLVSSFGYSEIVKSEVWKVDDVSNTYKTKYFCNKDLSKQDCDKNIKNMQELDVDIDHLNSQDIKSLQLNKISYKTTNTFPASGKITSKVSGLLILPDTEKPKGVVLYYHPTVFDNSGVPSNLDKNNKTSLMLNTIYAALYAANGYIVVAPDYMGQGDDYKNYHPYVLYPQQTVNTAIDLLNDISNVIKEKYKLSNTKRLNLFSVGYSEGAPYSIWTAKCLESTYNCDGVSKLEKLYRYRAAVGLSGAYDISSTTLRFMIDNNDSKAYKLYSKIITSMLKPALVANTLMSYLNYSNTDKTINIKDIDKEFFNMKCSTFAQSKCDIDGKHYTLANVFNQKDLPNTVLAEAVFSSSLYKKFPNQESASHYSIPTGNNSMLNLLSEKIFHDREFLQTLQSADIVDFGTRTRTPIFIFSLKEDSIVTPLNYDSFMAKSNAIVDGFVLDNDKIVTKSIDWLPDALSMGKVDHITGEVYANLFAYKYIDDLNKVYI